MKIRRARPTDLDALTTLHEQFCHADDHPFQAARARRAFGPLLSSDRHGIVWMIDDPGSYAVLTWGWSIEAGGAEAILDEIFVSDSGRGIGGTLIDHLLTDAMARGMARVFLETEAHNTRVRSLYQRHGFVVDDSVWMSCTFDDLT